jgi:hypothetical protein
VIDLEMLKLILLQQECDCECQCCLHNAGVFKEIEDLLTQGEQSWRAAHDCAEHVTEASRYRTNTSHKPCVT